MLTIVSRPILQQRLPWSMSASPAIVLTEAMICAPQICRRKSKKILATERELARQRLREKKLVYKRVIKSAHAIDPS